MRKQPHYRNEGKKNYPEGVLPSVGKGGFGGGEGGRLRVGGLSWTMRRAVVGG